MNIPRFTAAASLPVARGSYQRFTADAVRRSDGVAPALVGRWDLGTRCQFACIEVCTRFCRPTGWDCCQWETRCALSCDGKTIFTI
jgi:hypothetical protein